MGRKSSSKGQSPSRAGESAGSGKSGLLIGAIVVAVLGIGAYAMIGRSTTANPSATADGQSTPAASAEVVAKAARNAAYGPLKQAALPPIPFAGYEPPRSRDVVTAAYQFTAEHPEIAEYVPCFCGCQAAGHTGNADCFIKARAENGQATVLEPHGVECAVCIDVATRSRQMNASGAGVTAIRAAIEKEFTNPQFPNMMATPKPPAPMAAGGTQ